MAKCSPAAPRWRYLVIASEDLPRVATTVIFVYLDSQNRQNDCFSFTISPHCHTYIEDTSLQQYLYQRQHKAERRTYWYYEDYTSQHMQSPIP